MRRQEQVLTRFTWTGHAGNGRFADPDNWDPVGGPPTSNDDATIPNGNAVAVDHPFVQLGQLTRAVTIRVPRKALLAKVPGLEDYFDRVVVQNSEALRLLTR